MRPIDPKAFRVVPGDSVKLRDWPTVVKPLYRSKKHYRELLAADTEALCALHAIRGQLERSG